MPPLFVVVSTSPNLRGLGMTESERCRRRQWSGRQGGRSGICEQRDSCPTLTSQNTFPRHLRTSNVSNLLSKIRTIAHTEMHQPEIQLAFMAFPPLSPTLPADERRTLQTHRGSLAEDLSVGIFWCPTLMPPHLPHNVLPTLPHSRP